MDAHAQTVLDFWFAPADGETPGAPRPVWFRKDAQIDGAIRARFGAVIAQALADGLPAWDADGAPGTLARIVVLDQFTRNVYRDTPRAFAGDTRALTAAQTLVGSGADRALTPFQRWFVYMPFEHAEDPAMQDRAIDLFTQLAAEAPATNGALDYALRHRDVIARFGRFPHRNGILARDSTDAEIAFLKTPGSGF